MRSKSSHVRSLPCESRDLSHRVGGDHGDARFIEDAMLQLHHLYGSPVATSDLVGQAVAEDRHRFAIGRANMRGKVRVSLSTVSVSVFIAVRSEEEQVGKLAC